MTGKDGFIYGRGVTDNKGAYSSSCFLRVWNSKKPGLLASNVVFVLEGEEEMGLGLSKRSFHTSIDANRPFFRGRARDCDLE